MDQAVRQEVTGEGVLREAIEAMALPMVIEEVAPPGGMAAAVSREVIGAAVWPRETAAMVR